MSFRKGYWWGITGRTGCLGIALFTCFLLVGITPQAKAQEKSDSKGGQGFEGESRLPIRVSSVLIPRRLDEGIFSEMDSPFAVPGWLKKGVDLESRFASLLPGVGNSLQAREAGEASGLIQISRENLLNGYVTVKPGWTLSGIAKTLWGDAKMYPTLKEYNGLDSDTIYPGQRLWLRPRDAERDLLIAQKIVWAEMTRRYRSRTGKTRYPLGAGRGWALVPLESLDQYAATQQIRAAFRESIRRVEWVDLIEIFEAMVALTETVDDLFYLAAVIETESDYRVILGAHGEIGPCQIKPTTGWHYLGEEKLSLESVARMLGRIRFNIAVGFGLLKSYGDDKVKALEEYNAGKEKAHYRRKVLTKYERYRKNLISLRRALDTDPGFPGAQIAAQEIPRVLNNSKGSFVR